MLSSAARKGNVTLFFRLYDLLRDYSYQLTDALAALVEMWDA